MNAQSEELAQRVQAARASRQYVQRMRLQAAAKRKPAARLIRIGAFGLLLGVASLGLGLADSKNAAVRATSHAQAPVLVTGPEDRLKLTYSYNVSPPAAH